MYKTETNLNEGMEKYLELRGQYKRCLEDYMSITIYPEDIDADTIVKLNDLYRVMTGVVLGLARGKHKDFFPECGELIYLSKELLKDIAIFRQGLMRPFYKNVLNGID